MALVSRRTAIGTGLSLAAVSAVGYGLWPRMDGYRDEVERQRQFLSSDAGLQELVRMATLAANSHNTQPWTFSIGDQKVSIAPDTSRRTPVVDPDDHHLYVTLGCAAENLVIAAAAQGRAAEVEIVAGDKQRIAIDLSPAAPAPNALYQAIPLRQSTRSAYDGQPIAPADMTLLEAAARQEGVSVQFFTAPADRDAILALVIQGNSAQMDDRAWVQELRDWLRFSPASALATGDGLFSACTGNPVMPDWIGGADVPTLLHQGRRERQVPRPYSLLGRDRGLRRRPGRSRALDQGRAQLPALCIAGDGAWHPQCAYQPADRGNVRTHRIRPLAGNAQRAARSDRPVRSRTGDADVDQASGQRGAGMKRLSTHSHGGRRRR